ASKNEKIGRRLAPERSDDGQRDRKIVVGPTQRDLLPDVKAETLHGRGPDQARGPPPSELLPLLVRHVPVPPYQLGRIWIDRLVSELIVKLVVDAPEPALGTDRDHVCGGGDSPLIRRRQLVGEAGAVMAGDPHGGGRILEDPVGDCRDARKRGKNE